MRIAFAALLVMTSFGADAQERSAPHHDHEIVFNSADQLLSWCEQEARAHFAGKGIATYQWTGRHFEDGNTLRAEGKLRASGNDVPITCRTAKGARERDAVIEIAPQG